MTDKQQKLLDKFHDKNYFIYDQYGQNKMPAVGPIGMICLDGAKDFGAKINSRLVDRRNEYVTNFDDSDAFTPGFVRPDYRVPVDCVRFATGEAKAVIKNTVRGHDLYIICDPLNYSCEYKMFGQPNRMSPDDHYQDLVRTILAASGKAARINVIMPFLYEGRQHRKNSRESLDCAYMLEELFHLGINNFITFDAHDDRVSNSVPISGFESIPTTYQILKSMIREIPDLSFERDKMMVISPDEGAIQRSMYFASVLGLPLGTFYKRRDYTTIRDGRNPIIAHEFLGDSVAGYDVLIVDDMISSGDSMLDLAKILKAKNARRIFCVSSFALFTDGIERFSKAHEEGLVDYVISTNLNYHPADLADQEWFISADMSKFIALLIDALNHNASMSALLDPTDKIKKLLRKMP
ncbi:MAG: ribose-phosphate pyrophosphokinase [Eubacteriales bacterium]|nr:ribose-phosphate pyrophosphokinase [Eubacteriales bacterium]